MTLKEISEDTGLRIIWYIPILLFSYFGFSKNIFEFTAQVIVLMEIGFTLHSLKRELWT